MNWADDLDCTEQQIDDPPESSDDSSAQNDGIASYPAPPENTENVESAGKPTLQIEGLLSRFL